MPSRNDRNGRTSSRTVNRPIAPATMTIITSTIITFVESKFSCRRSYAIKVATTQKTSKAEKMANFEASEPPGSRGCLLAAAADASGLDVKMRRI